MLLQLFANGLIAGSIFALVAVGFSLIFSTNRFVHFAHGSVVISCGYLLYGFFNLLHIGFILACLLTLVGGGVLGLVIYMLVYWPMRKQHASATILLIASLGIMILLDNLGLLVFGADVKVIGLIAIESGLDIFGAIVTPLQILIFFASLSLLFLVYLFVKYTKFGKVVRAVADNPLLASISGINVRKVEAISFVIGSVMAAFAGILYALEYNVEFNMGTALSIAGYTGAVIGGINSLVGSILGGYLLGLAENLGIAFLPSGYKSAIAFILLLIFLLFKPKGIFGVEKGSREQKIW